MDFVQHIDSEYFEFTHTYEKTPNRDKFKMHTHETCELYYFVSGKGVFHVEGNDYPLHPTDILIINNLESHCINIDTTVPYDRCVINFKKELITTIDKSGLLLNMYENRTPGKHNLFRRIDFDSDLYLLLMQNIINQNTNDEIQIKTNFYALMAELTKAFNNPLFTNDLKETPIANEITNYIMKNLESPLTIDLICKHFYLSPSKLHRIFKNAIGNSVYEYITVKRLMKARNLINSGGLPTKVYSECGFNDYSSFFRAYKKHFGTSPSQ